MPGFPARQTHHQYPHFIRASLALADLVAAGAAGVQIGTLPNGSRVLNTHVFIETAFNAATTNTLDIGKTSAGSELLAAATTLAGATGLKTGAPAALNGVIAADTPVIATYGQTGTAATTGLATVIVTYIPNN